MQQEDFIGARFTIPALPSQDQMRARTNVKIQARSALALVCVLAGAGCGTIREDGPNPVRGTTFLITTDKPLGVRQLVRTARVIAEYRQLTRDEIAEIQRRLSRIFADMVSAELELMRREPASASSSRPTRALARARVLTRLGPDFALPLLTPDNRSVVTFGRITGDGIEVIRTAFEIDAPVSTLPAGAEVTTPDGRSAMLVGRKR